MLLSSTTSGSYVFLLLGVLIVFCFGETMSVGGLGEAKTVTEEVQSLIDAVKSEVEEKSGKTFSQFKGETYKSQVVAGTNYFVKVNVGDGKFVHLRIYKMLPGAPKPHELTAYLVDKVDTDELQYFQ